MTLVDVLAAIVILASTVAILAPLTIDARTSVDRSVEVLTLRAALSRLPPPLTPAGEQDDAGLPAGCRLRWTSTTLSAANDTSHARLLTMQVVRGLGGAERVLAERFVPLAGSP